MRPPALPLVLTVLTLSCAPKTVVVLPFLQQTPVAAKSCGVVLVPGSPFVSADESGTRSLGQGDPTRLYTELFSRHFPRSLAEASVFGMVSMLNDDFAYRKERLAMDEQTSIEAEVPLVKAASLFTPVDYLLVIQKYTVNQSFTTATATSLPPQAVDRRNRSPTATELAGPVVTGTQLSHYLWFVYYDVKAARPVAYGKVNVVDMSNGARASDWISSVAKVAREVVRSTPFQRKK